MDRNHLLLGLPVMFAFAVAACSAPAIPDTQDDTLEVAPRAPRSADASPVDGSSTPAPTPAPTGDSGTPTPAPASCGGSADYDACVACCDAPSGGALARGQQAIEDCSCGSGACGAVCAASYCSGQKGDTACNTCLTNTCDALACVTPACQAAQLCVKTNCNTK